MHGISFRWHCKNEDVCHPPFDRMLRMVIISESASFRASDRVKNQPNVRSRNGASHQARRCTERVPFRSNLNNSRKRKQMILLGLLCTGWWTRLIKEVRPAGNKYTGTALVFVFLGPHLDAHHRKDDNFGFYLMSFAAFHSCF